jgi:hypothetical protein
MDARCIYEGNKAKFHCMPSASGMCYTQCDGHKASSGWMQKMKQERARAQLANTEAHTDSGNHKAAITWQTRLPG